MDTTENKTEHFIKKPYPEKVPKAGDTCITDLGKLKWNGNAWLNWLGNEVRFVKWYMEKVEPSPMEVNWKSCKELPPVDDSIKNGVRSKLVLYKTIDVYHIAYYDYEFRKWYKVQDTAHHWIGYDPSVNDDCMWKDIDAAPMEVKDAERINHQMLEALEAINRLKVLWLYDYKVLPEHEIEAGALSNAHSLIENAIKDAKSQLQPPVISADDLIYPKGKA